MTDNRPLAGLRVVEMGQLLAGPFAGTILGYFGAEVIKVEPPTGDPIRQWREVRDGMSLWYHSLARNKKSVTLDLKSEAGRKLAFDLLTKADVVIENFRPGAMEDWGLGPETVRPHNPRPYLRQNIGLRSDRSILEKARLRLRYRGLWWLPIH